MGYRYLVPPRIESLSAQEVEVLLNCAMDLPGVFPELSTDVISNYVLVEKAYLNFMERLNCFTQGEREDVLSDIMYSENPEWKKKYPVKESEYSMI